MEWLAGLVMAVAGLFGVRGIISANQKRKREQARRNAHSFTPPNVHGGPREASKKDAKAKGWIK